MDIASRITELFWIGALAAVPVALAVGGMCRLWKCRPATRHALWCAVLASFITPVIAGLIGRPDWFESRRVLAAADSLSAHVAAHVADHWDAEPAPAITPVPAAAPARTADSSLPSPSPNRAVPAAGTPELAATSGNADPGDAARVVAYFVNRALPALLGRSSHRPTEEGETAWPARIANATRDVVEAADVLTGLRTPPSAPSNPQVDHPRRISARTAPDSHRAREGVHARSGRTASMEGSSMRARTVPAVASPASALASPVPAAYEISEARPSPITAEAASTPSYPTASPAGAAPIAIAPAEVKPDGPRAQVRAWLAAGLAVRDSLADVPPLPASIWAGGAVLIAAIWTGRLISARRILARGRPAPQEMRSMVRSAAERLGLRRAPEVLVVADRVSPMIWCGLRPRLVIPAGLWHELDEDSRLSVVLHELAHLRRRDHRLCWLESLIGLVYWWHPAAWWARRRVRDEADLACDAWVLSVMPGQRRAYAEALVTTKSFLSMPGRRVTPGLGVMTGRTKRLARRLTMVMTQRVAPKTSVVGAALAMSVAMAGMFVTPGLACPPEEKTASAKIVVVPGVKAATARKAEKAAKARAALPPASATPRADASPEFFGEAPALEAMRARAGTPSAANGDEEAQIRRLEEQLRALEQRLEKLNSRAAGRAVAPRPSQSRAFTLPPGAVGIGGSQSGAPAIAVSPSRVTRPGTPVAPAAPARVARPSRSGAAAGVAAPAPMAPLAPLAPLSPMAPSAPAAPETPSAPEASIMSTSPFGARGLSLAPLAAITTEDTVARSYTLPEGKLEALTELMSRQDVPVLINPQPDHIVVHATSSQHEIFAAFIKLIHPEAQSSDPLTSRYHDAARALERSVQGYQAAGLAAQLGRLESLRAQLNGLAGQQASLEAQANEMENRAEEMRERADEMRDRAESLREKIEERSDSGQAGTAEFASALLTEAVQMESQADATDQQADELEAQADALEQQADALEDAAEDLEEALEEIEQARLDMDTSPAVFLPEASEACEATCESSCESTCDEAACEDSDDRADHVLHASHADHADHADHDHADHEPADHDDADHDDAHAPRVE